MQHGDDPQSRTEDFGGTVQDAAARYIRELFEIDPDHSSLDKPYRDLTDATRFAPPAHKVLSWISTHAPDGTPTTSFSTGQPICFRVGYRGVNTRFPFIAILIHNSFGDRVATLHSTHVGHELPIVGDGFVECVVDDLRVGQGRYFVMVDFGSFPGMAASLISMDCISNAAQIEVSLDGYVKGTGHDAYKGAAHRSRWEVHRGGGATGRKNARGDRCLISLRACGTGLRARTPRSSPSVTRRLETLGCG